MIRIAAALLASLLGGCSLAGSVRAGGRPVMEAHGGGHEIRVLDIESPLRQEKKIPILSTPEVFAAYVPSHVSGDLMIGEHWIFFKLRESSWLLERLQDPDPPATGDVPPERLKPLRDLDWNRWVVPHK